MRLLLLLLFLPIPAHAQQLLVLGFLGGRVPATSMVHREAQLTRDLQLRYPTRLHAALFPNHDGDQALQSLLTLLDTDHNGTLSPAEKSAARIVLFGHSWGASQVLRLARSLDQLAIPVLLTIQVDSVGKSSHDDGLVPPNVHQAINFYQTEGLLHGLPAIRAQDPTRTTILGNLQSTYRTHPVPLDGYPWFARTFMHAHIEIENDPAVWSRVEDLIASKLPPLP